MSYSDNPEHDAARHMDSVAQDDEARRALASAYRDDIMTAFTKYCIYLGPENTALPYPKDGVMRSWVSDRNVLGEATDLILDEKIMHIFAKVLQYSDCPHVSELRKAMGEEYARMWVDDLVEGAM